MLLQNVPGWGYAIKKLECANHACKCYRGSLEQLVLENPSYKGSGGLTQKMRKRLVSSARCAIRMRSQESDPKKVLTSLRRDLENGPRHCFGFHEYCSPDFCKTAKEMRNHPSSTHQPHDQHSINQLSPIQQHSSSQSSTPQSSSQSSSQSSTPQSSSQSSTSQSSSQSSTPQSSSQSSTSQSSSQSSTPQSSSQSSTPQSSSTSAEESDDVLGKLKCM